MIVEWSLPTMQLKECNVEEDVLPSMVWWVICSKQNEVGGMVVSKEDGSVACSHDQLLLPLYAVTPHLAPPIVSNHHWNPSRTLLLIIFGTVQVR